MRVPISVAMIFLSVACASPEARLPANQIVDVYATPAAGPWLADLYGCAGPGHLLRVVNDPAGAALVLRLGQPRVLVGSAFQIGREQLLVVAHRGSELRNLDVMEVRDLFAGTGGTPAQIWVFAPGGDVGELFMDSIMAGRPLTSQARLAASPGDMAETIANTPGAVGILPARWSTGDTRTVYTLPDVPVLALVKEEPQGALRELLACLQQ